MKKLYSAFLIFPLFFLLFLVTGCNTETTKASAQSSSIPLEEKSIVGVWQVDHGVYEFKSDGRLIVHSPPLPNGQKWELKDNSLILTFDTDNPDKPIIKIFRVVAFNPEKMTFTTNTEADGNTNASSTWVKKDMKISTVIGEFYFLERMALPPNPTLQLELSQDKGKKVILRTNQHISPTLPIPLYLTYLTENVNPKEGLYLSAELKHGSHILYSAKNVYVPIESEVKLEPIRLIRDGAESTATGTAHEKAQAEEHKTTTGTAHDEANKVATAKRCESNRRTTSNITRIVIIWNGNKCRYGSSRWCSSGYSRKCRTSKA